MVFRVVRVSGPHPRRRRDGLKGPRARGCALSIQRSKAAFYWTATASKAVARLPQAVMVNALESADTAGSVTGRAREGIQSQSPAMSLKDKQLQDASKMRHCAGRVSDASPAHVAGWRLLGPARLRLDAGLASPALLHAMPKAVSRLDVDHDTPGGAVQVASRDAFAGGTDHAGQLGC